MNISEQFGIEELRAVESILEHEGQKRYDAAEYEKYVVSKKRQRDAPQRARDVFDANRPSPIALAKHPVYGWAVIGSFGQGPIMIWWQDPVICAIVDWAKRTIAAEQIDEVVRALLNSVYAMGHLSSTVKNICWVFPGTKKYKERVVLCEQFYRLQEVAHELIIVLNGRKI